MMGGSYRFRPCRRASAPERAPGRTLLLLVLFLAPSLAALAQESGGSLLGAVEAGDVAWVRRLAREGASLGARDRFGRTALLLAVGYRGYNSVTGEGLDSAACRSEMVAALLDLGADPEERVPIEAGGSTFWNTPGGTAPLMKAVEMCDGNVVRELLRRRAPVNDVDRNGRSALANAVLHRNLEAVRLLLENGADPDLRDLAGRTPLMYIIAWGSPLGGFDDEEDRAVVTALLAARAGINAADDTGATVLTHLARWSGYNSRDTILRFLIVRGADPCRRDKEGKRPLDWTTRQSTRQLLLELQATCPP